MPEPASHEPPQSRPLRTLLVDNYDSYTFNLFQLAAQAYAVAPVVVPNDDPRLTESFIRGFDALIISPGPGRPQRSADIGGYLDAVASAGIPVLGVCLGHQALAHLSGGRIVEAPQARHGHLSTVAHSGAGLFRGLPQDFTVVRYHSLCVVDPLPETLVADARAEDGVVMALRHRSRPWWGVQFHPESVASEHGGAIMARFGELARQVSRERRPGPDAASGGRAVGAVEDGQRPNLAESVADLAEAVADRGGPGRADSVSDGVGPAPVRALGLSWRAVAAPPAGSPGPDPATVFARVFADKPYAFWLDSARLIPGYSRYSFMGFPGGRLGEVLTAAAGSGRCEVLTADGTATSCVTGDIFEVLGARLRQRRMERPGGFEAPLVGGYVGYFGYELRVDSAGHDGGSVRSDVAAARQAQRERRTGHAAPPDAVWMTATRYVAWDHVSGQVWAVAVADGSDTDDLAAAEAWVGEIARLVAEQAMTTADADQAPARSAPIGAAIADPEHHLDLDKDGYLASIGHIMDQLRAGESYEVCLTNELRVAYRGDPFALYLAQRRTNPAPYAAYLAVGASTVLCSSPEQFLRIGADGTVQSRPIKGTAARAADSAADDAGAVDDAIRDGLRRSEKTRAENLMIVDLLRNDLGRVCEIGSVTVPDFMVVETYETMHQLVSTVRGMLRADVAATDAVRACFPGGSMTGAPKVRTMEIIERLEGRPRGVYSGSLGYLSADGCADLNIVIRTAVVTAAGDQADTVPGKAQPAGAVVIAGASRAPGSGPGVVVGELTVGAGGAIVLGSDPEAEYQEMLTKLRAPIRALVERG